MSSTGRANSIIQVSEEFSNIVSCFHFHIEPVGSAKPKFSSKVEFSGFTENEGAGVALTCPAQGLPIPSFR